MLSILMKSKKINIATAFQDAAKGFKSWWIPLCLISSGILFTQSWLPKYLFKNFLDSKIINIIKQLYYKHNIISASDPDTKIHQIKSFFLELHKNPQVSEYINLLLYKAIGIMILVFLLVCFLYIATIIVSKISVTDNNSKKIELERNLSNSHWLTISYLVLSFIKSLSLVIPSLVPLVYICLKLGPYSNYTILGFDPAVFHIIEFLIVIFITLFLFLLGVYIYIRLYFTSFIITESSSNPFKAIIKSWKMTRCNFMELFLIFIITVLIDIISLISIIGFIPGTGFKYTLRASAYIQLKNLNEEKDNND